MRSHPSRVRGLKPRIGYREDLKDAVAPLTGAWIALSNRKQYDTTGKDMGGQQKYRQQAF